MFCGASARTPSTPLFFCCVSFLEMFCLSVGFQFIFSNGRLLLLGGISAAAAAAAEAEAAAAAAPRQHCRARARVHKPVQWAVTH